jgi:hypothetical protein
MSAVSINVSPPCVKSIKRKERLWDPHMMIIQNKNIFPHRLLHDGYVNKAL